MTFNQAWKFCLLVLPTTGEKQNQNLVEWLKNQSFVEDDVLIADNREKVLILKGQEIYSERGWGKEDICKCSYRDWLCSNHDRTDSDCSLFILTGFLKFCNFLKLLQYICLPNTQHIKTYEVHQVNLGTYPLLKDILPYWGERIS